MIFWKELLSELKKDLVKDTVKYFAAAIGGVLLIWTSQKISLFNSLLLKDYLFSGYSITITLFLAILSSSCVTFILFNAKYQKLKKNTLKDELTGLYNEKGLRMFLQQEIERAKNTKEPLSIILYDIDNFKNVNDTYSMNDGDKVMAELGYIFNNDKKLNDINCRQHNKGDEFIVIAKGFSGEKARFGAESKRQTIEKYQFQISKQRLINITVSCGVAEFNPSKDTFDSLIFKSDKAKQKAKEMGRNRTVLFEEEKEI